LSARAVAQHAWRFGAKQILLFVRTPQRAADLMALAPDLTLTPPAQHLADGGLTLVGWEQPVRAAQAGDVVYVAAYVQRTGGAGGVLELRLGEQSVARTDVPAGTGLLRLEWSIQIPAQVAGASVPWRVRLGSKEAIEGHLRVQTSPAAVPLTVTPQHAVAFTFGQPPAVQLLGYDLSQTQDTLRVTLYWQALQTQPTSLKVFVHLEDGAGHVLAQRDDYPVAGTRPTTSWRVGETLVDAYAITLTPQVETGTYALTVGLYDPVTGERLGPVLEQAGLAQVNEQAVLERVQVPASGNE